MFYGPQEIISQVEAEGFVTLTLKPEENGEAYELKIPRVVFEAVVSEEQKDWNYIHSIKLNAAGLAVIEVLMKYGITGGEIKTFLEKVGRDYFVTIDRAINYQFTGNDKRFVPGGDVYYDFDLNRAHEITKHLDGKDNTTTESES